MQIFSLLVSADAEVRAVTYRSTQQMRRAVLASGCDDTWSMEVGIAGLPFHTLSVLVRRTDRRSITKHFLLNHAINFPSLDLARSIQRWRSAMSASLRRNTPVATRQPRAGMTLIIPAKTWSDARSSCVGGCRRRNRMLDGGRESEMLLGEEALQQSCVRQPSGGLREFHRYA